MEWLRHTLYDVRWLMFIGMTTALRIIHQQQCSYETSETRTDTADQEGHLNVGKEIATGAPHTV